MLPPEILYHIIGIIVAEYIDNAIAGSLQLPQCHLAIRAVVDDGGNQTHVVDTTYSGADSKPPKPSNILSLLEVSVQVRSVTLRVVSDVLNVGIHLPQHGLEQ